jgi:RNA polymerase sigma-70 factor (ECF subfamily)
VKYRRVPDDRPAHLDVTSTTSVSLLEQVRQSDPEGWRRLVSLYGPLVYSWCRQRGLESHDAADVGQEVFQSVLRNISRFRRTGPGDSFRGWLRMITRNKINDHWRRRGRRPNAEGGTDAQMRLSQTAADELSRADELDNPNETKLVIRRACDLIRNEFEDRTWQAFWQTAIEGRLPADVAADLGMTTNAVNVAKCRVLSRVRAEFQELLD